MMAKLRVFVERCKQRANCVFKCHLSRRPVRKTTTENNSMIIFLLPVSCQWQRPRVELQAVFQSAWGQGACWVHQYCIKLTGQCAGYSRREFCLNVICQMCYINVSRFEMILRSSKWLNWFQLETMMAQWEGPDGGDLRCLGSQTRSQAILFFAHFHGLFIKGNETRVQQTDSIFIPCWCFYPHSTSECDSHVQNSPFQHPPFQTSSFVLLFKRFPSRFIRKSDPIRCYRTQAPPSGLSSSIRIHPSSCLSIMPSMGGASSPPQRPPSHSASQSRCNHIRSRHPLWCRPLEKA